MSTGDNLYIFTLADRFNTTSHPLLSPTIRAALATWQQISDLPTKDTTSANLQLPILSLSNIIPNLNITYWPSNGLETVEDLLIGPAIKTF